MKVTDLPNDILTRLPHYLGCLDDWYATIQTCRRFYQTCAHTKATFPAFCARDPIDGYLPMNTDFLMAGSARQVADWVIKCQQNRQELCDAIRMEDDEGLLKMSVEIARWSVEDVRALHDAEIKVIEPLSKAIAAERGTPHRPDCCAARKFDGLESCDENETLCALRTDRILARASLYGFVIYCNLFHLDIEESYGQLPLNVGLLGSELRRLWMKSRMFTYELYVHISHCKCFLDSYNIMGRETSFLKRK